MDSYQRKNNRLKFEGGIPMDTVKNGSALPAVKGTVASIVKIKKTARKGVILKIKMRVGNIRKKKIEI